MFSHVNPVQETNGSGTEHSKHSGFKVMAFTDFSDTLRMIVFDQTGEAQLLTDNIRQVRGLVLSKWLQLWSEFPKHVPVKMILVFLIIITI